MMHRLKASLSGFSNNKKKMHDTNNGDSVQSRSDRTHMGLYRRIVEGLERKPAYLLIFAIAALFVLSGLGTSAAAIAQGSVGLGVLAVTSFALALMAAVIVVRFVESNTTIDAGKHPISAVRLAELVLGFLNRHAIAHTANSIAQEAPKITEFQDIGSFTIDEIQLVLDALQARERIELERDAHGGVCYRIFD